MINEEKNYLYAFDPGKRTGVAIFTWDGEYVSHGVRIYTDVGEYLDRIERAYVIVYEGWRTRPGGKTAGSTEEASQVIGQIKNRARQLDLPQSRIIEQQPAILPIAAKWAGFNMPKGHLPDDESAWLHGYYCLRQHGRVRTSLELRHARGRLDTKRAGH